MNPGTVFYTTFFFPLLGEYRTIFVEVVGVVKVNQDVAVPFSLSFFFCWFTKRSFTQVSFAPFQTRCA